MEMEAAEWAGASSRWHIQQHKRDLYLHKENLCVNDESTQDAHGKVGNLRNALTP